MKAIIIIFSCLYFHSFVIAEEQAVDAIIETKFGNIELKLFPDVAPGHVENFVKLAKSEFFDGTVFHRVIPGFMIQGGDPTGTGRGGPGYEIKDEFTNTDLDKNNRGTLSMANSGPNSGGSQFFINLVDNNFLDGKHPVFGKVVEGGMDIVDKIAKLPKNSEDKPLEDVVIIKAVMV